MGRQNIQEYAALCKGALDDALARWGMYIAIFLLGIALLGLIRLRELESGRAPVSIRTPQELALPALQRGGGYVASVTGSAYFYPWCAGAAKINAVARIVFNSEDEARAAGFSAGKNCKGLSQN